MKKVRLSIIVPTCGRPSLYRTLYSILVNGIEPEDEIVIVEDGPQPEAARIVSSFSERLPVKLLGTKFSSGLGGPQRNHGMANAIGTHLLFMDDDDVYTNGGISKVRNACAEFPEHIVIFRMRALTKRLPFDYIWQNPDLVMGNVSSQMFTVPNNKDRLAEWSSKLCNDFDFLMETTSKYPAESIIWRHEVIAEVY